MSTSSAINATFYGASHISYIIAKEGELPVVLEKKIWNRPIEGLVIISGITLLVVNLFDLSSIATMGSAGFLLIFAAVNACNLRLYRKTASYRWISAFGVVVCVIALGALVRLTATISPQDLCVLATMIGLVFTIEAIYRKFTGRVIRPLFKSEL